MGCRLDGFQPGQRANYIGRWVTLQSSFLSSYRMYWFALFIDEYEDCVDCEANGFECEEESHVYMVPEDQLRQA